MVACLFCNQNWTLQDSEKSEKQKQRGRTAHVCFTFCSIREQRLAYLFVHFVTIEGLIGDFITVVEIWWSQNGTPLGQ